MTGIFRRGSLGLCLALACLASLPARAQSSGSKDDASPLEVRNSVSVILLSGLVGGVLGLSTLSFYDKPQDNIRNITFGAGAGLIAAVIFLTATAASQPPPLEGKKASLELAPPMRWIAPSIDPQGRPVLSAGLRF